MPNSIVVVDVWQHERVVVNGHMIVEVVTVICIKPHIVADFYNSLPDDLL